MFRLYPNLWYNNKMDRIKIHLRFIIIKNKKLLEDYIRRMDSE